MSLFNSVLTNMIDKLIIVVAVVGAINVNGELKSYDGYTLYQLQLTTEIQVRFLQSFEGYEDIQIWSTFVVPGAAVDVVVAPWKQKDFLTVIEYMGISVNILTKDMKSCSSGNVINELLGTNMTWDKYYKIDAINKWMDSLPEKYPGKVEVLNIGKSYENRDMKGVKISLGNAKKSVLIEGGIHAREWISPATVTYIINELLTTENPRLKKIAQKYNWYVFPSINPDGYAYSYTENRGWRKTRSPNNYCIGADMNRNFPFHWCTTAASSIECGDAYCGKSVLSEIESKNFAKFVESVGPSLDFYLAFHSFSQMLILPYGNTSNYIENNKELYDLGIKTMDALSVRYGTKYEFWNIGLVSGNTVNWATDKFDIPVSYTYELRPSRGGGCGFSLLAEQILPNSEEVVDSLIVMFEEAKNMGLVD